MNGTGFREISLRYTLMDLLNSESLQRNISRYQQLVGEKIRNVAESEIELAMVMEMKKQLFKRKVSNVMKNGLKI